MVNGECITKRIVLCNEVYDVHYETYTIPISNKNNYGRIPICKEGPIRVIYNKVKLSASNKANTRVMQHWYPRLWTSIISHHYHSNSKMFGKGVQRNYRHKCPKHVWMSMSEASWLKNVKQMVLDGVFYAPSLYKVDHSEEFRKRPILYTSDPFQRDSD